VKARILHALGEIDDAALQLALAPPKATQGGDEAVAHRNLKFAQMMMKAGKPEKALPLVEKAIERAPDLAAAHALLGSIKAEAGDCAGARAPLEKALALDPEDATARAAAEKCKAPATAAP
jgi:Tfp pilus assembly protein PilF